MRRHSRLAEQEQGNAAAIIRIAVGRRSGIFDGLTAWFEPGIRAQIVGIVIGSTVKGLITGVCIGYFAKKVNSLG